MSTYSSLLKTPGVSRIIAAQLTARFPFGMLSLAFLLHIERIHHSYGAAGLVLGAMSIGQAIAGPMTSRLMGVLGMRVVLWTTLAFCSLAVAAIGIFVMPIPVTMGVAFFAGLSRSGALDETLHRAWLAAAVVAVTLTWSALQVTSWMRGQAPLNSPGSGAVRTAAGGGER